MKGNHLVVRAGIKRWDMCAGVQDEDSRERGRLPAVLGPQLKTGPPPFSSSHVQVVGL